MSRAGHDAVASFYPLVRPIVYTLLIFISLVTAGVSAQSSGDTLTSAAIQLNDRSKSTLVILYPEGSLANIEPVASSFTRQTGVEIALVETTVDDINTRMLLDAARGVSAYDIALPATFGIPDLVEAGALRDVSDFAEKYEPLIDYRPSLYDLGDSYKGKKYGYQTDGDAYVMFYNKEWLEDPAERARFESQFGRALEVPDSWHALDQLMAFFHRPDRHQFGGCLFRTPRYMVWEWWIRFHALGGLPVDEQMRPEIAGSEGVAALSALIRATASLHPSASTNGLFENWQQYAKRNCFANIGWGGTQKYLVSEKPRMRHQMVHTPTPGVSYFNWGWNYVVSAHSKQPELAYVFTLFATTGGQSTSAVREEGFFDPFRQHHYADEAIVEMYTESFLAAHQQSMKQSIPDFYLEGQGRYIDALQEAIVLAHDGDVTAQEALDYAASRWEEITDEIGRSSQIEQWLALRKKYPGE